MSPVETVDAAIAEGRLVAFRYAVAKVTGLTQPAVKKAVDRT